MWAGVLFFLFCVGTVFYVFEHLNIWIQRNEVEKVVLKNPPAISTTSVHVAMDENTFSSSKFIFKKVTQKSVLLGSYQQSFYSFFFQKHRVRRPKDIFHGLSDCILYTYSMLLVVSLPRLPQKWAIRLLTGWYWVYCILIVVAYRSSLTAILANPAPRLKIDTLEELANSPIGCGVWGAQNRQFFLATNDSVSNKIGEKIELIKSASDGVGFLFSNKWESLIFHQIWKD